MRANFPGNEGRVANCVRIPVVVAAVLFIYLHRRHVRRLRAEDLNDPHKSLDFGWDPAAQARTSQKTKGRKAKNQPEMTVTDLGSEKRHHDRGLSMDMDLGSPYVLPPGLNHSRESLHSMSRTIHTQDDRYRPATSYNPNDAASLHSQGTRHVRADDSSSFAGSSMRRGPKDEMKQDLLGNAQRVSRSLPPMDRVPGVPEIRMPEATKEVARKALPPSSVTPPTVGLIPGTAPSASDTRDSYVAGDEGGLRRSNTYLGKFIHRGNSTSDLLDQATPSQAQPPNAEQKADEASTAKELPSSPEAAPRTIHRKSPPPALNTDAAQQHVSRPPRQQSLHASTYASTHPSVEHGSADDSGIYAEHFKVDPPSPHDSVQQQHQHGDEHQQPSQDYLAPAEERGLGLENAGLGYDIRRLSVGIRPLPPDDPTDNPEQRANRIRSFYKEYFDDSKPGPAQPSAGYYEDYDENYLGEGATYFDPVSGQFITTAGPEYEQEPYGRRAMTPPPRVIGGRRHAATLSGASRQMPPGPRAFSSASARFGPSGRAPPQKKLPPPSPLRVIPTPHLLKEDAFALPIDFAPPTTARDRQAGRPESPRGGLRPYSPMVPAHMPLASSYDDLAVMPSP